MDFINPVVIKVKLYIMNDVGTNEQEVELDNEAEERPTKEVLIRNSDMAPEEECVIVSITNSAI